MKELRPALLVFLALTLVTGVAYPLLVTGLGQAIFGFRANGSLIAEQGRVVGSELIGQSFADPGHFWGRLSATGPFPYNAGSSSGSNYGPLHPSLADAVTARIEALHAADPGAATPVPVDLVTASGSGLDPHVSPAAAEYQVVRVARARGLDPEAVRAVVRRHTESRQFGLLGEPRVNVLLLNLELDSQHPVAGGSSAPPDSTH
jgi:K+-transporting ATPase ATPase C chain